MNLTLDLLSKSGFENYVKSLLALSITRNAILPVVFDRIKGFQEKCLADICEKNNIPPGTICTECPTKTIIASPLLDNSDKKSGCPNKICNHFKYEIDAAHRYKNPSFSNSDATLWCSNPWEIAKCYMSPGYKMISSKEETDFNGIISVVINYTGFPDDDIVQQARVISNQVRHSPSLEMMDGELQELLEILNKILVHKEFFLKARDERKKLEELRVISLIKPGAHRECKEKGNGQNDIDCLIDEVAIVLRPFVSHDILPEVLQTLKKVLKKKQEENEEKHEMPNLCSPNGKLLKLNDDQLKGILQNCENSHAVGGFGKVHVSKTIVPGLDIRVVVKEISCEDTDLTKISTTFNEKISRRVMHFAIVPLIGFINQEVEERTNIPRITKKYFFLSPYLGNGSLRSCLERDASEEDVKMTHRRRIEILFQVASAIHYLHTDVKGYRGIVLHMDITSSNIVLDEHFNARLIDFGLAREMNEYQTKVTLTPSKQFGTPGYFRTKRYSDLTVCEDYYNFGVVIREILTGKAPYIIKTGEPRAEELRNHGEGTVKKILQKNVWTVRKDDGNKEEMQTLEKERQIKVDKLVNLSTRCLRNENRSLTSADILKDLKEIRVREDFIRDLRKKCDICMINPRVKNNRGLSTHNCCGKQCCGAINVCLSCMRNSHLNPIVCPTCGEIVIPEIGHTFAAVLIAGYDVDKDYTLRFINDQDYTQSYIDDVKAIKTVLASKYPCVIGISEERIKVVTPESPGQKEDLLPKIAAAFESLHESQDIRTLLFYYTGHCSSKTGFQLFGNKSVLNLTDLQAHFEQFCKKRNETKRIIAFLDCCEAPGIKNIQLKSKQVQIFQLNACRQNEEVYQEEDGSLFRRLFVQALTRRIFNKDCIIQSDPCTDCEMSGEFISITKMLEYISEHIESKYKNSKPAVYLPKETTFGETCFGYNIDFAAEFEFKFQNKNFEEKGKIEIEQGIYCDIDTLKSCIHHALCEKNDETLMFPSSKFLDTLSLQIYNGQQHGDELQSMLQVSAAMDNQQCVVVSVRPVSRILKGRVVLFPPQTEFIEYLKKNGLLSESTEPQRDAPATVTLSKEQLDKISDDIKNDDVLKTMSSDLDEVYKKWDDVKTKGVKELKITFPEKDNGSHEFILLELIRES